MPKYIREDNPINFAESARFETGSEIGVSKESREYQTPIVELANTFRLPLILLYVRYLVDHRHTLSSN